MSMSDRVRSVRCTNVLQLPANEVDGVMTRIPDREWFALEMAISQHPKGIVYRAGGAVKDAHGRIIGRDADEQCIKPRRTCESSRSKLAVAGAGRKVRHFTQDPDGVDAGLDTPVASGPGYHMVNRGRRMKGHSLRSMVK